ncbi:MAG TPA: FGGY family carbohydrate kinase [Kofleriaceae bacterium]|jgi:xylulokinase
MWLVGLDLGTQSVKAVVCDATLAIRGAHAVSYATTHPQPGWAEQDPFAWEAALRPAIHGALAMAKASPTDVVALAIAAQLDGCIAVDVNNAPLHPALIWQDRRATAEAALADPSRLFALAGQVADASHFAAKLVWLREHLGGQDVRPARYHQPTSYLVARLTGTSVMDASLASTTMLYALTDAVDPESGVSSSSASLLSASSLNASSNAWSTELCAMFGVDPRELPAIAATCDVAGTLTADGARLTGLPAGVRVAVGTGDDFANALGAGIVEPGTILCAVGTAEVVGALATSPLLDVTHLSRDWIPSKHGVDPRDWIPSKHDETSASVGRAGSPEKGADPVSPMLETHVYPVPGAYFIENPGWLSGGAVRWATKMLRLADDAALDALAARAPAGCDGVTFIPALNGSMTPVWRPGMRGALHGLSASHGPEHIARAVLEGLAFACKDVVDRLAAMGLADDHVVLAGGGAQSALWAQIRADVLGLPHRVSAVTDASPLGAAMIAAVAVNVVPDLRAAAALVPGPASTAMPDPAAADAMGEAYRRYQQLVGIALSALV